MDEEPEGTFLSDGKIIYLRCVDEHGNNLGGLRIAETVLESYARTLVRAANAGMRLFRADAEMAELLAEGETS